MKEKKIVINGLKSNYKITGSGPVILILHGWGRGSDSYISVQENLADSGYKVIVPDLPGFGKTEPPASGWDVSDYAEWVNRFVSALNIRKFYLLAHSFGGRVAIKFAIVSPQKVLHLILYEAAGIKHKKTFFQSLLFLISKTGNIFSFLPGFSFLKKCYYKFIVRKKDYFTAKGTMKRTFLKVIEEDLTPILSKISVPTFLIWGDKDKQTPLSDGFLMEKEIPNSKLKIVPNRGHAFHHKAAGELTDIILKFLKQCSQS